jgi:ribonuclease HI
MNGWVKLNTDGASKEEGWAGCGGIIRGSDGEWLGGFAKNLGRCSAFVAELWGVYEGLSYVRRLGFREIMLDVDSSYVAHVLTKGVTDSIMGRSLVTAIRRLLEIDWHV